MLSFRYADADERVVVVTDAGASTQFMVDGSPRLVSLMAEIKPSSMIEPYAPTVSASDIVAERSRRIALGFDFDFGGDRGLHRIGTTEVDLVGWREVTDLANAMLSTGQNTPITIVTNTGPCQVTPDEWQSVLLAGAVMRQPLWNASFALAQMDPIPADFRADHYWL